ncbi:hypothetical protein BpHYR1_019759 [Brachionus plicatilis]|uniref:Uncharacterized protein n=1 Tax=Brachionus plicatilis TaxID=10195 RepID=A0A3M7PQV2_BRAPC|nr:hypothetical protein BpHYR1_019759 [Brachionus plicatilis]
MSTQLKIRKIMIFFEKFWQFLFLLKCIEIHTQFLDKKTNIGSIVNFKKFSLFLFKEKKNYFLFQNSHFEYSMANYLHLSSGDDSNANQGKLLNKY